jgi:aminopeptidase N
MGDPAVIAQARQLFAQQQANPQALDGPLKTTWLDLIAQNATEAEWNKLLSLARNSRGSVERANYYLLLGRTSDGILAQRALQLAVTDEPGLTTSATMIAAVAAENADQAVTFFLDNRARVEPLIDTSGRSAYLARLASGINDPNVIARVEALAKTMSADEAKPLASAFGIVRERTLSRPRAVAEIKAWLENG